MLWHLLERSVASSDRLLTTHALNIYIFEADCDLSRRMTFRSGSLNLEKNNHQDVIVRKYGRKSNRY